MIQVNSLTDKKIFKNKIDLIVSDLDFTLTDFSLGHKAGIKNISNVLDQNVAKEFNNIFNLIHEEHTLVNKNNWDKQTKFDKIISQMKTLNIINNKYGFRKYSREIFFIVSMKRLNLEIKDEKIGIARDAYWSGVSDSSPLYVDAKNFLLKLNKTPIIIMR